MALSETVEVPAMTFDNTQPVFDQSKARAMYRSLRLISELWGLPCRFSVRIGHLIAEYASTHQPNASSLIAALSQAL